MAHFLLRDYLELHPAALAKLRRRRTRPRIKPGRPSKANELWYKTELLKLVRFIRRIVEADLLPAIRHEHTNSFGDAAPMDILYRLDLLAKRFGNISITAKRLARLAATKNLAATDKQLIKHIQQAMGIDIQPILDQDGIRDEMLQAINDNVSLIQSIPTEYLQKIRDGLQANWDSGERWEDLTDFVQHVGDITESRAKLIGRDQTSKMNGAFNRARQTSIGIKKYSWLGMDDGRERPTHMENNGHIFSWDNPPEETGNPGDDINCRCVAIPEFDLDEDD